MRWVIEVRPFRLLVDCIAADSAIASSSASLGRLWALCCFRSDWLFRAVEGELRDAAPGPKLPDPPLRRCGWLSKDAGELD